MYSDYACRMPVHVVLWISIQLMLCPPPHDQLPPGTARARCSQLCKVELLAGRQMRLNFGLYLHRFMCLLVVIVLCCFMISMESVRQPSPQMAYVSISDEVRRQFFIICDGKESGTSSFMALAYLWMAWSYLNQHSSQRRVHVEVHHWRCSLACRFSKVTSRLSPWSPRPGDVCWVQHQ